MYVFRRMWRIPESKRWQTFTARIVEGRLRDVHVRPQHAFIPEPQDANIYNIDNIEAVLPRILQKANFATCNIDWRYHSKNKVIYDTKMPTPESLPTALRQKLRVHSARDFKMFMKIHVKEVNEPLYN